MGIKKLGMLSHDSYPGNTLASKGKNGVMSSSLTVREVGQ